MRLMQNFLLLIMFSMIAIPNILFAAETKSNPRDSEVTLPGSKRLQAISAKNERTKRIIFQTSLEQSGQELLKEKRFEEAIVKFEAAAEIDKELYGSELGGGYAGIARVYEEQGKFELALERVTNLFKDRPKHRSFADWKMKLEALIQAKKEGTNQPIYNYIDFYRKKYKKDLSAKGYWVQSAFYASQIIQLYDRIGDAQGGISFIDRILSYPKLDKKTRDEYSKVKQAFIDDKATGAKGHATNVLIQSDYFPW